MDFARPQPKMTGILVVTLGFLTGVTPLATGMYLAAFPAMATDLSTAASNIQLTLTAFMVGLAIGQFVIGPLSDQWGRKVPLLVGTAVCLLSAYVAALAPTIGVLIAARFVMGLFGAAGIVIARSMITDLAHGAQIAKLMNLMMIINGLAPVIAPALGGVILSFATWRTVFWVLSFFLLAMLIMVLLFVPESLPAEKRISGGLGAVVRTLGTVVKSRRYMGFMLAFVFAFGTMFSYISGSSFALQNVLGMNEGSYAIAFAVNSLGIVISSAIAGKLLNKFSPRTMGTAGIFALTIVSALFLVQVLFGLHLVPALINLFCLTSCMGFILGNVTTLALAEFPRAGGAASALLGALQFVAAGLVSPLVSVAGESSALPMAVCMLVSALLSVLFILTTPRQDSDREVLTGHQH